MVFNATWNNISVLLVEKPEYPENTTHLQFLSHNDVSRTPRLSGIRTHNVSNLCEDIEKDRNV